MKTVVNIIAPAAIMLAAVSCEVVDNDPDKHVGAEDSTYVGLEDVAGPECFLLS